MIPEKIKSYDFDAEGAIIGHVICRNDFAKSLFALLPEHFYSAPHADIWQAICELRKNEKPITPFTIAPLLADRDAFEDCGGINKYLAATIPTADIYGHPSDIEKHLIHLSKKREFEVACINSTDVMEIIRAGQGLMNENSAENFINNMDVTERIMESMKIDTQPFSTGFSSLDDAMDGGMYPKKSYAFAARKKMGKTMLGATLSHNLNVAGIKHLFICGEMSPEEIQQRVMCRLMNCYPSAFRSEFGKSEKFLEAMATAALQMPRNVIYRNAPGLTFDELKHIVETAIEVYDIRGFILDYWQLVGGKGKGQSTAEHQDEVAQWIADYTRKKDLFSITFAQINQEGNTRGGEGIRLAFDQVYELKAAENDPSRSGRWLEMRDTRYTKWINLGSDESPRFNLVEKGLYFEQIGI